MSTRIDDCFNALRREGRPALVTFVMAGDPDSTTSFEILRALPSSGADIVELGMPFTDPMADGPAVQRAGARALAAGQTLAGTLDLVARFRADDMRTPVVLMGYFNPIHAYGVPTFLRDARRAGVDGLIVVDCPPEEDSELCIPARAAGLSFIRLATPTSDEKRIPALLKNTSGFLYYVSITGVTGAAAPDAASVASAVERIKAASDLPVVVGFGVKDAASAATISAVGDGVVVGSVLADAIGSSLKDGAATATTVSAVKSLVASLAEACRAVKLDA